MWKKRQEGKVGAAGRGRAGLYERGHWPGGGATWEIPSYSTQAERCHLLLAPTVIIISLTPAATRSLPWHPSPPYTLRLYTGRVPQTSSPFIPERKQQTNENNENRRKTLKYITKKELLVGFLGLCRLLFPWLDTTSCLGHVWHHTPVPACSSRRVL